MHSFDLVASAPGVVACNMASVPLDDASVGAAVFSLALMGTDYGAFLLEAKRVSDEGGGVFWTMRVWGQRCSRSLALMGMDYRAFLLEAKRVSKDIGRACSPALTCAELDRMTDPCRALINGWGLPSFPLQVLKPGGWLWIAEVSPAPTRGPAAGWMGRQEDWAEGKHWDIGYVGFVVGTRFWTTGQWLL